MSEYEDEDYSSGGSDAESTNEYGETRWEVEMRNRQAEGELMAMEDAAGHALRAPRIAAKKRRKRLDRRKETREEQYLPRFDKLMREGKDNMDAETREKHVFAAIHHELLRKFGLRGLHVREISEALKDWVMRGRPGDPRPADASNLELVIFRTHRIVHRMGKGHRFDGMDHEEFAVKIAKLKGLPGHTADKELVKYLKRVLLDLNKEWWKSSYQKNYRKQGIQPPLIDNRKKRSPVEKTAQEVLAGIEGGFGSEDEPVKRAKAPKKKAPKKKTKKAPNALVESDDDEDVPLKKIIKKKTPKKPAAEKLTLADLEESDDDEDVPLKKIIKKKTPKKPAAEKLTLADLEESDDDEDVPLKQIIKKTPKKPTFADLEESDDDEDVPVKKIIKKKTPKQTLPKGLRPSEAIQRKIKVLMNNAARTFAAKPSRQPLPPPPPPPSTLRIRDLVGEIDRKRAKDSMRRTSPLPPPRHQSYEDDDIYERARADALAAKREREKVKKAPPPPPSEPRRRSMVDEHYEIKEAEKRLATMKPPPGYRWPSKIEREKRKLMSTRRRTLRWAIEVNQLFGIVSTAGIQPPLPPAPKMTKEEINRERDRARVERQRQWD